MSKRHCETGKGLCTGLLYFPRCPSKGCGRIYRHMDSHKCSWVHVVCTKFELIPLVQLLLCNTLCRLPHIQHFLRICSRYWSNTDALPDFQRISGISVVIIFSYLEVVESRRVEGCGVFFTWTFKQIWSNDTGTIENTDSAQLKKKKRKVYFSHKWMFLFLVINNYVIQKQYIARS